MDPVPYRDHHHPLQHTLYMSIHKIHVDCLDKPPCSLQDPCKGTELVQSSGLRTHIVRPESDVQYRLDFSSTPALTLLRATEECDSPINGAHPSVPLLEEKNHHLSLPIQRHCPQCPTNVAELSQPQHFVHSKTSIITSDDLTCNQIKV